MKKNKLVKNSEKKVAMFLELMKKDYKPLRVSDLIVSEHKLTKEYIIPKKEIGFK
jgi:hypothetical protein